MAEGAIFLNSGPLFNAERLESFETLEEWEQVDEAARGAFERVKEAFEKHATLLAGNPSAMETRYFMVSPTLHALGYMHSAEERIELGGEQQAIVDYSLFPSAHAFHEAEQLRGSVGFYHSAVGIVRAIEWGRGLDDAAGAAPAGEEGEEAPSDEGVQPGAELDLLLRTTGMDYGFLTNGCDWRVYHRATSELGNTWFQADMIAAMKSDFEDFKRFYLLFSRDSLLKGNSGESFLDRLLQ